MKRLGSVAAAAVILASTAAPSIAAAQFVSPPYAFCWEAGSFRDLAVAPNGDVYTARSYGYGVDKYRRDGRPILELTGYAGEYLWASGIEVDGEGNLYVVREAPNRSSRLFKFGPDGSELGVEYIPGTGVDVTIGSDGNIYVTSRYPNTMSVFSPDGDLVEKRDYVPVGRLSADAWGHYYQIDRDVPQIRKCTLDGSVVAEWPMARAPENIDVAPDGTVMLAVGGSAYAYAPDGRFLGPIGVHGLFRREGEYYDACAVAANSLGDIYVADQSSRNILMYGVRQPGDDPPRPDNLWPPLPPEPWPPMTYGHTASVILHLAPLDGAPCLPPTGLADVVTSGTADPAGGTMYRVYLLATPNTESRSWDAGTAGLQLGIDYDASGAPGTGLVVHDWHLCAVLDFADDDWPGPGTGNTICWGVPECQQTDVAVAGYFTVTAYSAATMSVVPWPNTGLVKVADCSGGEKLPDQALGLDRVGWVSLGGGIRGTSSAGCNPVFNPCGSGTPVERTTWGRIKTRYR